MIKALGAKLCIVDIVLEDYSLVLKEKKEEVCKFDGRGFSHL